MATFFGCILWLECTYRPQRGKSLFVSLSRTQAGAGRTVKQEQEEISRNHVQTLFAVSVCGYCSVDRFARPMSPHSKISAITKTRAHPARSASGARRGASTGHLPSPPSSPCFRPPTFQCVLQARERESWVVIQLCCRWIVDIRYRIPDMSKLPKLT